MQEPADDSSDDESSSSDEEELIYISENEEMDVVEALLRPLDQDDDANADDDDHDGHDDLSDPPAPPIDGQEGRTVREFESDDRTGRVELPRGAVCTRISDVWRLFFDDILHILVARSNAYLRFVRSSPAPSYYRDTRTWPPKRLSERSCPDTTVDELRRYLGLKMLMGLMPPCEQRWYWGGHLISPGVVSAIMSRQRFEQLEFFLHASDPDRVDSYAPDNKIGKVSDVFEKFRLRCSALRLPGTLALARALRVGVFLVILWLTRLQ